ncbi:MAG: hypothetical protein QM817_01380 [Archangium sp.]
MAKAERPWLVTPHTPLQQLDDNLWEVSSQVPGISAKRRMSIVRLSDGALIFYHAIPLDDATLATVLALGTPRALVIGYHSHGVDAAAFADKLKIGIYGPSLNEGKMRARWPQYAGTLEALPKDAASAFEMLDGTKLGDPVQVVRSKGGVSLVFCDALIANDDSETPFLSRLIGFGGGPRCAPFFTLFLMNDRKKLRAHLERLADLPGLVRLVPCHGRLITDDASGVLRRVAGTL